MVNNPLFPPSFFDDCSCEEGSFDNDAKMDNNQRKWAVGSDVFKHNRLDKTMSFNFQRHQILGFSVDDYKIHKSRRLSFGEGLLKQPTEAKTKVSETALGNSYLMQSCHLLPYLDDHPAFTSYWNAMQRNDIGVESTTHKKMPTAAQRRSRFAAMSGAGGHLPE